jgi:hypothetical protein
MTLVKQIRRVEGARSEQNCSLLILPHRRYAKYLPCPRVGEKQNNKIRGRKHVQPCLNAGLSRRSLMLAGTGLLAAAPLAGMAQPMAAANTPDAALPFMIVGGLVAADFRLPIGITAVLTGVLGLILGYPNGLALAESGQGLRGVIGSTASIFVLVTLIAALAADRGGMDTDRLASRRKLESTCASSSKLAGRSRPGSTE